jgi:serine/threonine protein phosphatase PrpC
MMMMMSGKKSPWVAFGKSVIGASHIRKNQPNQDAYMEYSGGLSDGKNTPALIAVSDGHGGNKYIRSGTGSSLAVEVICKMAEEMFQNDSYFSPIMSINRLDESAEHLKARFHMQWNAAVERHYNNNPFVNIDELFLKTNCSDKDYNSVMNNYKIAYGCTFLASIVYDDLALILQYGDGDVLGLYPNKDIADELIAADPRNIGNQTLSLCTLKTPREIQHRVLINNKKRQEVPLVIMLSSDGVKNSFNDLTALQGNGFYRIPSDLAALLLKHNYNSDTVGDILENELTRITKNGSGDDVTIGVLFNKEKINQSFLDNSNN